MSEWTPETGYQEALRRIEACKRKIERNFLNLHGLSLTSIPPEISRLSFLEHLDLQNNLLTSLPPTIGQLSVLTLLNLGGNQLASLPPEIGQLSALSLLNLEGNQLTSLLPEIGRLPVLTQLNLAKNKLTYLPPEIGQLSVLTLLILRGNQLTSLPPAIGQLSSLTLLDIQENFLTSLPSEIGQLSALKELDLWKNELTSLPPDIGRLSALAELNVGHNQLTSLPPEIAHLSDLTELYLWSNQLKRLPSEIGKLLALTVLNIDSNQLHSLPPEIGNLSKLAILHLGDNQLSHLPAEIGSLSELRLLYIEGNQLTSLPAEMRKLESLTQLFLHKNPGLGLNDEALGPDYHEVTGSQKAPPTPPFSILSIYFAQQSSGTKALNELKVILVGRGGAGKTSIRKRLIEDRFDPKQQETAGIEIDHWELDRKKDGITAHVWDFAGQDITHATHQFFLTRRSLYLLVLEGRSDLQDRDAEYWLRLIRAFGADSPVIVVLNKWDEKPFAVADFTLRQEFPQIRGFIRTDCRTGLGLVELKQTLRKIAASMETVKQEFPRIWFSVKEEMVGMKENYLPLCRYREICRNHAVTVSEDQDALAGYLHDLGIILHYADDERLSDTTVLNPRWVTASVYTLLRHVEKRQTGDGKFTGYLSLVEARSALTDTNSEMVKYLVGLMERFELCYPLEEKEGIWLIPQLLAPQSPQNLGDKWFTEKATRLRYEYNVLPEGLLPRFVVRAHPLISENLVWRQGVVLEMEDDASRETARALVIAEPGKERIQVTVIGAPAARLRLTKLVRAHFKDIHQDFNRNDPSTGKQVNNLNARELMELEEKPGIFKSVKALLVDEKKGNVSTISTDEEGSVRIDQKQELDRVAAPEGKERRNTAREIFQDRHKIFLSYAHHDAAYRDVFAQNLKVMEADGIIDWWYDGKVLPSENFDQRISQAMHEADVIVILLSTASLGSKYIREVELRYAKEAAERLSSAPLVVPVLLEKDCAWMSSELGHLQTIPGDGTGNMRAVDQWPSRRKAFNAVEQSLRKLLAQK